MFEPDKIVSKYDGRPVVTYDIMPRIQKLLSSGYYIRNDGKVTTILKGKSPDPPWIYTRSHPELNCTFWHEVMFGAIGIFPPGCMNCWKVVVRPRTIKELIYLLEVQDELTTRYCKCGIEVRGYVPALYGGYFYNQSQEEGLECLEDVRKLVAENISPDIPVVLKRYCTEFELKFGPSDELEETLMRGYFIHPDEGKKTVMQLSEMQIWRHAAEQIFDVAPETVPCDCAGQLGCMKCHGLGYTAVPQPPFVKQHVIHKWFEWAWAHGDMTVKEFFGGEPLYTPSVRYEKEINAGSPV